jgi:hypothetical protein
MIKKKKVMRREMGRRGDGVGSLKNGRWVKRGFKKRSWNV